MESYSSRWVPIREAARLLGVSIDTIRRWDEKGIIHSNRLKGRNRYFDVAELERVKATQPLTISEAAKKLGVSASTLRRLEKDGLLTPKRSEGGERLYSEETIHQYIRVAAARRRERKSALKAAPLLNSVPSRPKTIARPGTFFERVKKLFVRNPRWAVAAVVLFLVAVAAWGRTASQPTLQGGEAANPSYITWAKDNIEPQPSEEQDISSEEQMAEVVGITTSEERMPGSSSSASRVAGTTSARHGITFESIYDQQPGIERAITADDKEGGLSFDIYAPAEYLYIDLRDDGTKFVVRDHEHDTLTIDHDKNIIAHGGSKLDIQGTLTLDGQAGDANQVLTSQGKGQTPVWKNFGEVTVGGVDCTNCLNEKQIEDIYVLNTGDEMSGNLTLTGQSDVRFAAPGSNNY
ncbi:MAG: MerR family DNA-binding transcriptional regulator, partial [Patescibacteria group bacterium]